LKNWPALDASCDQPDLLLAAVDDFSPTAVEERDDGLRVFFATSTARDAAVAALLQNFRITPIDVDDEDWARRSQQNLKPISVGRVTVLPSPEARVPSPESIAIVIPPSMGFGTGHHVTTRLCLAALQSMDLRGSLVLDVGTGSGLLAIAAVKLGATRALGIDDDPDAIAAATENLEFNGVTSVEFVLGDHEPFRLPGQRVPAVELRLRISVQKHGGAVGRIIRRLGAADSKDKGQMFFHKESEKKNGYMVHLIIS